MAICDICNREIFIKQVSVWNHPLYSVLRGMIRRCYAKTSQDYKNYGGRGIKICDEWLNDSRVFISWCLLNGWKKGLHLDRINVDGNYTPENCRFISNAQNQRNRSNHVYLEYNGEKLIMSDMAKKYNILPSTLWYRLNKRGMSINEALTSPMRITENTKSFTIKK